MKAIAILRSVFTRKPQAISDRKIIFKQSDLKPSKSAPVPPSSKITPAQTSKILALFDGIIGALKGEVKKPKHLPKPLPNQEIKKTKFEPSPVQKMYQDQKQTDKYFKPMTTHEIEKNNQRVRFKFQQPDYTTLFDMVIKNNLRDIFSLDGMQPDERAFLLSATVDPDTYTRLTARCWEIKSYVERLSPIGRMQVVSSKLSDVFN